MSYESEMTETQGAINRLRSELRQSKLPQRTITWQHNNVGKTRGITQRVLIARKQRKQMVSNIKSKERRMMSLRQSILGVE